MNTYYQGATVRLTATYKVAGVLTDPTTVTLKTKDPLDATSTYTYGAAQITKSATGTYYKDVQMSTPGVWHYRFEGTGTAAGVEEARLYIDRGEFA